MKNTLSILHITDLHSHKPFYEWVYEQSENFDVICITGDLIGGPLTQNESTNEEIDFVINWLERITTTTLVCSGNHDIEAADLNFNLNDFDSSIDDNDPWDIEDSATHVEQCEWLQKVKNNKVFVDNAICTIKGIAFGIVPYNYTNSLSHFLQCDILLHHEPPAKSPTAIQKNVDWGSLELYESLKNKSISPKYILCGHVHNPQKNIAVLRNTTIYNPGAKFSKNIPRYQKITIDLTD